MSNPFQKLKTDNLVASTDVLGGGGGLLDSDIYTVKVKALYAGQSAGGAMSLTLVADNNGKEYRETFYVTNKSGDNYYTKDKVNFPLPGYTIADDICLITAGTPLNETVFEEKTIKIYNHDTKTDELTQVQMAVEALGKEVALGILRQKENKSEKDPSGKYVPTPEPRELNLVSKVFHPEMKVTVAEAIREIESVFWDKWLTKNKGVVNDRFKAVGNAPSKGTGSASSSNTRTSIFGKK